MATSAEPNLLFGDGNSSSSVAAAGAPSADGPNALAAGAGASPPLLTTTSVGDGGVLSATAAAAVDAPAAAVPGASASSAAAAPGPSASAPVAPPSAEPNTLFVKVDRLRRLCPSREHIITAKRGEDGTFGLSLSDDNAIVGFNHRENAGPDLLREGDQIRAVNDAPLVREKLAALLERKFPGAGTVDLHISRKWGDPHNYDDECFVALQMRDARGNELDEWVSDLWAIRTDAVWGTFFTVPILPGARSVWVGIHLSHLFSEPLIGASELNLERLPVEALETRWHSLRSEDDERRGRNELEGEVLLTVRKYASNISVSYGQDYDDGSSDDEPSGPVDHATEPLAPIPDFPIPFPAMTPPPGFTNAR